MFVFLNSSLIILYYMIAVFIIARIRKDNSIADVAWGPCFLILALYWLIKTGTYFPRQIIATSLAAIWSIRLTIRLGIRNVKEGEDQRYKDIKKKWKKNIMLKSFFYIFMLQGFLILIIASPLILINSSTQEGLSFLDVIGWILWSFGFYFEALADYQLDTFLSKPENKGKILKDGLWTYSRHPNYFGESLIWWGFFLMASNIPYGILTIISPLTITYLLHFVSGIPLVEKIFANNPEYQEYKKTTNMFIPWWPKKSQNSN